MSVIDVKQGLTPFPSALQAKSFTANLAQAIVGATGTGSLTVVVPFMALTAGATVS
jgi:hypothetical protein